MLNIGTCADVLTAPKKRLSCFSLIYANVLGLNKAIFLEMQRGCMTRMIMQKNNRLSVSFSIWIKLNIWLNRLVCKDIEYIHDQDMNSPCRCILSCFAEYANVNHFLAQFKKAGNDQVHFTNVGLKKQQQKGLVRGFSLLLKPELGCICWSYVLILAVLSRETDVAFCSEGKTAPLKKHILYICTLNHVKQRGQNKVYYKQTSILSPICLHLK